MTKKKLVVKLSKIFRKEAGYSLVEAKKLAKIFLTKWWVWNATDVLIEAGFSYEWEWDGQEEYKKITGLVKKDSQKHIHDSSFTFTDEVWDILFACKSISDKRSILI